MNSWKEELKKLKNEQANAFDAALGKCIDVNRRVNVKMGLWKATGNVFDINPELKVIGMELYQQLENQIVLVADVQASFSELRKAFSKDEEAAKGFMGTNQKKIKEAGDKYVEGCCGLVARLEENRERLTTDLAEACDNHDKIINLEHIMKGIKIRVRGVSTLWIQNRYTEKTSTQKFTLSLKSDLINYHEADINDVAVLAYLETFCRTCSQDPDDNSQILTVEKCMELCDRYNKKTNDKDGGLVRFCDWLEKEAGGAGVAATPNTKHAAATLQKEKTAALKRNDDIASSRALQDDIRREQDEGAFSKIAAGVHDIALDPSTPKKGQGGGGCPAILRSGKRANCRCGAPITSPNKQLGGGNRTCGRHKTFGVEECEGN